MATSVAKAYANTVKKNQRVLFGVWEPGLPVQLGDYGTMNGNIFVPQGNIREFEDLKDFKITIRKDNSQDEKTFTSEKGVQYELKPKVSAPINGVPVNASIEFTFSKENAVFFNAAGCEVEMIENKNQLGQKIMQIHEKDKNLWRKEFVLVTDLVHAKRALIIISTSNDFSVGFEADAKVPVIDLASASLGLKVKSQNSSGYKVSAEEGLIPLIGLGKIQKVFLGDSNFEPLSVDGKKNISKPKSGEKVMVFGDYTANKTNYKD